MVNYPEVTRKIQEEVDRVLGDKQPKIEDRARMPYTEAVILEGLRIISSVRLSGYRMASQDIEFDGMTIPKGSLSSIKTWETLTSISPFAAPSKNYPVF